MFPENLALSILLNSQFSSSPSLSCREDNFAFDIVDVVLEKYSINNSKSLSYYIYKISRRICFNYSIVIVPDLDV